MNRPALSVIIVNYNTCDATLRCLRSVLAETVAGGIQIVVVDNGSVDDSANRIRAELPVVEVVEAGENLGFARGVNLGVKRSSGEFVLLLNPDTIVLPGALDALMSFALKNPSHGLYGGRTLRPDGTTDPSSCWGKPTLWSLLCFATGLSTVFKRSVVFDPESLGKWGRDTVRDVPIVTGCLLLCSRSDWDAIGGMDEAFFLYGEDAEFSLRARRKGYRPVVVPGAVIVHEVGGSTASSGRKMCMVMAGKATLLKRTWGAGSARVGILMLQLGSLLRAVLEFLSGRRKGTWETVWRARADWREGYPAAEERIFGRRAPVGVPH